MKHNNPSVMKHSFSNVPSADIPRSSFNRSHAHKTCFNAGVLIPVYVDEVLPGDTFNLKATLFARLATPIVPIMDNMFLDVHYFAVPLRLVWDNFQRFMGEQKNPADSTDFIVPYLDFDENDADIDSLFDYMGIPTEVIISDDARISALFCRAYNLIWNEWYRDQNLQDSIACPTDDGPDDVGLYGIMRRGKRHDYFTSCLPWPQKGPGVEISLGDTADVVTSGTKEGVFRRLDNNATITGSAYVDVGRMAIENGGAGTFSYYDPMASLVADLSTANPVTINDLRQAFQLQKLLERDARGGTRYTEIIRSHFGTVSPDSRLQRPEFLGGSSTPVIINPVAQTSATSTGTPLGDLAGYGMAIDSGNGFVKSFTEHCIILGLVSVRADLTYQQGLPKMFTRSTKYDFYWPALAHLGEQAVLNEEIYFDVDHAQNKGVFGYQERFAEYRYYPSKITNKLRSTCSTPLDFWHLSQHFTGLPTLSDAFITDQPPVHRVVAVPSEPQFIFDSYFDLTCARPMPVYSVPGLIDHF